MFMQQLSIQSRKSTREQHGQQAQPASTICPEFKLNQTQLKPRGCSLASYAANWASGRPYQQPVNRLQSSSCSLHLLPSSSLLVQSRPVAKLIIKGVPFGLVWRLPGPCTASGCLAPSSSPRRAASMGGGHNIRCPPPLHRPR